MDDREYFYQMMQAAEEQRKRRNFNAFMNGLEKGIIDDLNKAYASGDMENYQNILHNIKERTGFRIFRNSKGEHKIKVLP